MTPTSPRSPNEHAVDPGSETKGLPHITSLPTPTSISVKHRLRKCEVHQSENELYKQAGTRHKKEKSRIHLSLCPYVSILPTGMYLVNPSHLEINQLGIFPAGNIAHWLSTGLPCIRVLNSIPSFGKQEKRKKTNSWAWQCTSVIPALWRPRQGQLGLPAGNGNWEQRIFYL